MQYVALKYMYLGNHNYFFELACTCSIDKCTIEYTYLTRKLANKTIISIELLIHQYKCSNWKLQSTSMQDVKFDQYKCPNWKLQGTSMQAVEETTTNSSLHFGHVPNITADLQVVTQSGYVPRITETVDC